MLEVKYHDIDDAVENIESFFQDVVMSEDDEYGDIEIVALYDEARRIISSLCRLGYNIKNVSLHEYDLDNYNKEYVISLESDGIWCEELWKSDENLSGYIWLTSKYIYIMDNCNSKILNRVRNDAAVIEISLDDEEEKTKENKCPYSGKCDECEYCEDNTVDENDDTDDCSDDGFATLSLTLDGKMVDKILYNLTSYFF